MQPDETKILNASEWLKKSAAHIDPKRTHLAALSRFVSEYTRNIKSQLSLKAEERLFTEREPILREILDEVGTRIKLRNLTYEFIFALPFQVSILLDMRIPLDEQPSYWQQGDNKVSLSKEKLALQIDTYRNYERFIELLEDTWKRYEKFSRTSFFQEGNTSDFSFWVHVHHALVNFKTARFLPLFGELSIEALNEMSDLGVWPAESIG